MGTRNFFDSRGTSLAAGCCIIGYGAGIGSAEAWEIVCSATSRSGVVGGSVGSTWIAWMVAAKF